MIKEHIYYGSPSRDGKTLPPQQAASAKLYQQLYDEAIANGCTPVLADMLASRKAPTAKTDREFFRDRPKTLAEQFRNPRTLQHYINKARKHGYNPSPNDYYDSSLARFAGDPEGFISPSGGRTQYKRTLQKRGWGAEDPNGLVNVAPAQFTPDPPPDLPLSNELIDESVTEMLAANPDLQTKPRVELEQMAVEKHGPRKKR